MTQNEMVFFKKAAIFSKEIENRYIINRNVCIYIQEMLYELARKAKQGKQSKDKHDQPNIFIYNCTLNHSMTKF